MRHPGLLLALLALALAHLPLSGSAWAQGEQTAGNADRSEGDVTITPGPRGTTSITIVPSLADLKPEDVPAVSSFFTACPDSDLRLDQLIDELRNVRSGAANVLARANSVTNPIVKRDSQNTYEGLLAREKEIEGAIVLRLKACKDSPVVESDGSLTFTIDGSNENDPAFAGAAGRGDFNQNQSSGLGGLGSPTVLVFPLNDGAPITPFVQPTSATISRCSDSEPSTAQLEAELKNMQTAISNATSVGSDQLGERAREILRQARLKEQDLKREIAARNGKPCKDPNASVTEAFAGFTTIPLASDNPAFCKTTKATKQDVLAIGRTVTSGEDPECPGSGAGASCDDGGGSDGSGIIIGGEGITSILPLVLELGPCSDPELVDDSAKRAQEAMAAAEPGSNAFNLAKAIYDHAIATINLLGAECVLEATEDQFDINATPFLGGAPPCEKLLRTLQLRDRIAQVSIDRRALELSAAALAEGRVLTGLAARLRARDDLRLRILALDTALAALAPFCPNFAVPRASTEHLDQPLEFHRETSQTSDPGSPPPPLTLDVPIVAPPGPCPELERLVKEYQALADRGPDFEAARDSVAAVNGRRSGSDIPFGNYQGVAFANFFNELDGIFGQIQRLSVQCPQFEFSIQSPDEIREESRLDEVSNATNISEAGPTIPNVPVDVFVKGGSSSSGGDVNELGGRQLRLFDFAVEQMALPEEKEQPSANFAMIPTDPAKKPQHASDGDPIQGVTNDKGEVRLTTTANVLFGDLKRFENFRLFDGVTGPEDRVSFEVTVDLLPMDSRTVILRDTKLQEARKIVHTINAFIPGIDSSEVKQIGEDFFFSVIFSSLSTVDSENAESILRQLVGEGATIEINTCREKKPLAPRPDGTFVAPDPSEELRGARISLGFAEEVGP